MRWPIRWSAVLILAGFSAVAGAQVAAVPADPLLDQMKAAIANNDLASLRPRLDRQAFAAVADLQQIDGPQMIRIAALREMVRYFGQLPHLDSDQQNTLTWLVAQPRLMPTLMSAVNRKDAPDQVLSLLATLREAEGEKLDQYADLATAILIVWDKPLDPGPQSIGEAKVSKAAAGEPDHVVKMFNYFLNSPQLYFDPRDLPWQLAIYMVDVKISPDEILWALNRYATKADIGEIYFDVPYDDSALYKGTQKKIDSHPYTLENLVTFGGVCVDQAYYATQIAKIRGIPSCVCTGQSGAGEVGHAWAGFLEAADSRAAWNFDTARYKEDLYWEADIVDPHTHDTITDADVGLLAELQHSDRDQRMESSMLMKLADMETPARRMEFYRMAIHLSPGNRIAWMSLAQLGAEQELPQTEMNSVGQVVHDYAAQRYPDFACYMLEKMAAGMATDAQVASLDQIAALFRQRPDLQARIRIRQGELLHSENKDSDALMAYGDVLTNDLNAGPIVLLAIQKVDDILRAKNDLDRLAKIYDQVWRSMPVPSATAYATQSPYYEVGTNYARLLDELGNSTAAENVREQLQKLVRA
jgi:hypothetical protein